MLQSNSPLKKWFQRGKEPTNLDMGILSIDNDLETEDTLLRRIESIETEMDKIQKSTSVTFPVFSKAHNILRQKYEWYYNWHLWPYFQFAHAMILFVCLAGIFGFQSMFFSGPKSAEAATATYTYASPIVVQNPAGATSAAAYYGNESMRPTAIGTEVSSANYTSMKTQNDANTYVYTLADKPYVMYRFYVNPAIATANITELAMTHYGFSDNSRSIFVWNLLSNTWETLGTDTQKITSNNLIGAKAITSATVDQFVNTSTRYYYFMVGCPDINNVLTSDYISSTVTYGAVPSTPTITTPSNNATAVVTTPTIISSAYSGLDTHLSTDREVYNNIAATPTDLVWSITNDAVNLTTTTVNLANGTFSNALAGANTLAYGADYWVKVRYNNVTGPSAWSPVIKFTTGPGCTWNNSSSDGLWATAANWSCGRVPSVIDNIIFDGAVSNADVTMNSAAVGTSLTVKGTDLPYTGDVAYTGNIHANANLTINSTDTANGNFYLGSGAYNANATTVKVSGSYSNESAYLDAGTSTFEFTAASGNPTISSGGTALGHKFYNLTVSGNAQVLLGSAAIEITNNLINSGGSGGFNGNNQTVTIGNNATTTNGHFQFLGGTSNYYIGGNFTFTSGGYCNGTGTLYLSGNLYSTRNYAFGPKLDFVKAAGEQTLRTGGILNTFDTLTHSGTGTLTVIESAVIIRNNFVQTAGTFDGGTTDESFNDFSLTGGIYKATSGIVTIGNYLIGYTTSNFLIDNSVQFDANSGTFKINISGNLTSGGKSFYNLFIGGGYMFSCSSCDRITILVDDITVNNNLSFFYDGDGDGHVRGSSNRLITVLGNLTTGGVGADYSTTESSITINLYGNATFGDRGYFQANLNFVNTTADQTITQNYLLIGSPSTTFTVDKNNFSLLLATNWTMANGNTGASNILVNSGKIDLQGHLLTTNTTSGANFTINNGELLQNNSNITVGVLTINGGTFNAPSATLSILGNYTKAGGTFAHNNGLTTFSSTSARDLNSGGTGSGNTFYNFSHTAAATLRLTTNSLEVDGNFINSAGTFNTNGLNLTVGGDTDLTTGTFTQGTGTITLDGSGAQTFTAGGTGAGHTPYNLIVANMAGPTSGVTFVGNLTLATGGRFTSTTNDAKITFADNGIYNFSNITLNGTSGHNILMPAGAGAHGHYHLNVATVSPIATYVTPTNSDASGSLGVIDATIGGINGGGNTNWLFNTTPPNVPSSLGSSTILDGSFGNDTTPAFAFSLSDTEVENTVKYQIQIDNDSNFSSPVTDYTSALSVQGSKTFSVGQAAGTGAYTVGAANQTLSDGSYYWRVRAYNNYDLISAWANDTATIDFKIDITIPTTDIYLDPASPNGTNSFYKTTAPNITFTSADGAGSGASTIYYKWESDLVYSAYSGSAISAPEGDHTISYYGTDVLGNSGVSSPITRQVKTDTVKPSSTVSASPSGPNGSNNYYTGTTPTVTISATDATSGLLNIYYKWSLNEYALYSAPVSAPEGTNTLYYYGIDNAGNSGLSTPNSTVYNVDLTSPTVSPVANPLTPNGDNGYYKDSAPTISFETVDDGSGISIIKYKWDSDSFQTYGDAFAAPEGTHTLYYYGIDNSNNESETANQTFKVDTISTVTDIYSSPTSPNIITGYYTISPSITFGAIDTNSGVNNILYRWGNSGAYSSYTEPLNAPGGTNTIYYYGVDNAGNIQSPITREFKVDTIKPTASHLINPINPDGQNGFYKTKPTITLSANSNGGSNIANIYYKWGLDTYQTYSTPFLASESDHTLSYYSTNMAGNTSDTFTINNLHIDITPPRSDIFLFPSEPNGANGYYINESPWISFSANDFDGVGVGGLFYKWGETGEYKPFSSLFTAPSGINTLYYYSTDLNGNSAVLTPVTREFKVDISAPSAPINLSARTKAKTIDLSWNNPTDQDVVDVAIFRSTESDFTPTISDNEKDNNKIANTKSSTAESFVDSTAKTSTIYYYRVKALDVNGNYSDPSNLASTKIEDAVIIDTDDDAVTPPDTDKDKPNTTPNEVAKVVETSDPNINSIIAEVFGIKEENVPAATSAAAAMAVAIAAAAVPIANATTLLSLQEYFRSLLFSLASVFTKKRKKWGKVLEAGTNLPIAQAKINLMKQEYAYLGDKSPYKLMESTYSDKNGAYAFIAEPGIYTLQIEKDMYHIDTHTPGTYKPGDIIEIKTEKQGLVVPYIVLSMDNEVINKKFSAIRNIELFERVFSSLSLILVIFGTATIVSALMKNHHDTATIAIALVYPLLWYVNIKALIKKSPFGDVEDIVEDKAVPAALIRIMDKDGKRLVKTVITNDRGKYRMLINKGKYKLLVAKEGYQQNDENILNIEDQLKAVNQKIKMEKQ